MNPLVRSNIFKYVGVFQYAHDENGDLTDKGKAEAKKLAKALAMVKFDRTSTIVATAPARKAIQTGQIVADYLGIPLQVSDKLGINSDEYSRDDSKTEDVIEYLQDLESEGQTTSVFIVTLSNAAWLIGMSLQYGAFHDTKLPHAKRMLIGGYGHGVVVNLSEESIDIL